MKCCICGKEIENKGGFTQDNNAWPVKDGRCCDHCNNTVIIPERVRRMTQNRD